MKTVLCVVSLTALLGLSACSSKTPDLDAPCPDYGRYCHQIPVNAWDNEKLDQ